MPRQRQTKQPLTEEEKIKSIKKTMEGYDITFVPDPVYEFNVGDSVRVGNLEDVVIYEKCLGGKYYIVDFTNKVKNNYNNITTIPHDKRGFYWHHIRPLEKTNESLIENSDIRMSFSQNSMEGLLTKVLSFGVDMNPDYQRDLVWSDEDKEALIDSVFHNIDIGKFCFVNLPYNDAFSPSYQILDGKQRLTTLVDFYLNKFPYKGKYYNDLSRKDKNWFENYPVSVGETRDYDREQVLRHFIMLNTAGHVMDKDHIKKVEELLEQEIQNKEEIEENER